MKTTVLLQKDEIEHTLERLTNQIVERRGSCDDLVLLGIRRRGADLAARLARLLTTRLDPKQQRPLPQYALDINLYRDDWTSKHNTPVIGTSFIPESLDDKNVLLVDDVLFTGRTIRAALEAIMDYGRPRRVELLVLVDRGHRELPIHADYVGLEVTSSRSELVNVFLTEQDDKDEVLLMTNDERL